jgi:hypothetical protein
MATKLTISVTGINDVLASFDVIRIKRSITGDGGPYELITDLTSTPATLTAPLSGNYNVVNKTLSLIVDQGGQIDVLFTGTDPLTVPQVVDQINTAVGESIASDVSNTLVLTSTNTGTASVIEIVGGGAAVEFGWSGGERDIGEDPHIVMQPDVSVYSYTDEDGDSDYFYVAQFFNTANNLQSNDSAPFQGGAATLVSASNLSTVKVDLVDGAGVAIPDQEISFYPTYELHSVEGFQVALNRAPITIKTDNAGHAEKSLVRGARFKVVFEGTTVIREIVIPDAPETDLLAEMGLAPDPFDIETPNFPFAIRRTL